MSCGTRWAVLAIVMLFASSSLGEDVHDHLADLKEKRGFQPRVIVDCGANVGRWTTATRRLFPTAKIIMVEANPDNEPALRNVARQTKAQLAMSLLMATDGETREFFSPIAGAGNTGSGVFRERTKWFGEGVVRRKLSSRTLDSILAEKDLLETVDVIKIDVQGAELPVLLGAGKALKAATYVLIEHSLVSYNEGSACWFEVDAVLRSKGFFMADIRELHALFGVTAGQFDGLYLKPSSPRFPASKYHEHALCTKVISPGAAYWIPRNDPQERIFDSSAGEGIFEDTQERIVLILLISLVIGLSGALIWQGNSRLTKLAKKMLLHRPTMIGLVMMAFFVTGWLLLRR